ncbi:hypothetical protein [Nitrospira sp. Nam74]
MTTQALATGLTLVSAVPSSDRVHVYYNFRPTIFGQPNLITPAEEAVAVQALQLGFGLCDPVHQLSSYR